MGNPQKAKGSSWERDVANHLSELYGETFIRAPGSGAYVGGTNSVRKEVLHEGQIRAFKGDIVPGESFPHFNAECKSYQEFPFHQLWSGYCRQIDEWLAQLLDVEDPGDFNILIIKITRKGKYVAVESKHNFSSDNFSLYTSHELGSWHIFEYDHFWQEHADTVKTLCK